MCISLTPSLVLPTSLNNNNNNNNGNNNNDNNNNNNDINYEPESIYGTSNPYIYDPVPVYLWTTAHIIMDPNPYIYGPKPVYLSTRIRIFMMEQEPIY